ncbi:MAG: efflux RND transporter periplasmic adaptor subunit [Janthinobacterium lividum]
MSIFRNRLTVLATAAAVIVAAGGFAAFHASAGAAAESRTAPAAPAAATVDVATVISRQITDWQDYSGRLEAVDRVEIRPLVSGTLTAVHFKDGALVKKGDVLFTIDPRPYAAETARASAQLAGAEARAAYTASDLARGERLLADNAIARRDYDEKQNTSREAAANLLMARAGLVAAQLNLEHTRIVAPVSGRISRAEVTPGNVVTAGSTAAPLTTLVSVASIYAGFDVDEQSFLKYVNPSRASGATVPVQLGLANEEGTSRHGKVSSVDNRVDTSSGTVRVRAVFDNADGALLPGLYARVRLGSGSARDAVLIDEKAIGTDQDKSFVLVLDQANHATYREVRTGAIHDGLRVVASGLKSGERIVVNGLQRVRPGDTVSPHMVTMTASLPPTVKNAPSANAAADPSPANAPATAPAPAGKASAGATTPARTRSNTSSNSGTSANIGAART